jgi:PAS domain S-box-containing protein
MAQNRSERKDGLTKELEAVRQRAEESFRFSEARLRQMLATNPVVVFTLKVQGETLVPVWTSPSISCLGYSPEETLTPAWWADHLHPDDRAPALARMPGLLQSGRLVHEYRVRRQDGDYRWVRDELVVVRDAAGRPVEVVGNWTDVTARKQAEADLEQHREHLEKSAAERTAALAQANRDLAAEAQKRKQTEQESKTILETAIDGFWMVDKQGRILEVNAAYSRMSGYRRAELLGMSVFDIDAVETPEETRRHIEKIIAEGNDRFQSQHRRKDGSVFDVEVSVQYLPLRGGIFISFFQDITDRKRAEEALRLALQESKQRHAEVAALLKGARSVIAHPQFQPAARAIYDACKELVGATAGYVALLREDGQEFDLLFLDAAGARCTVDSRLPMPLRGLRAEACRALRPVYENAFPQSAHVPLLPPGHVALENVLFVPLVLQGRAVGSLGLANKAGGFTENDTRIASAFAALAALALQHSRALQLLEDSEQRFRSVAHNAGDAIVTADASGTIISWNPAAERLFGYRSEEILGQPVIRLVPERLRAAHQAAFARALSQRTLKGPNQAYETTGCRKDGTEVALGLSVSLWQSGSKAFSTAIIRDITERKRTEETLRHLVASTSALTGEAFFESLVRELAEWTKMRWVVIGAIDPGKPEKVTPLAMWGDSGLVPAPTYDLAGTPCARAVELGYYLVPAEAATIFPEDKELTRLGVASYVGTVLGDEAGKPVGVLCCLHDQPLTQPPRNIREVLTILANRAGAEMRRLRAERALREHTTELERFNNVMVGREARIIELKEEINRLCAELGREPAYPPVWRKGP